MMTNNFNGVLKISDSVLGKSYLNEESCNDYGKKNIKNTVTYLLKKAMKY
jgi:hypothetical protein